ncbi:MAG: transglycosylase family protein [Candidatus Limnocylindria bacterium]
MPLLRRSLLLLAVAVAGIALLAPLAARSAVPIPTQVIESLLPVAGAPTVLIERGALAGRQGATTPTVGAASPAESLAAAPHSPPSAPMEATLVVRAPAPVRVAPRPVTYSGTSVWDDLARCESGGNWAINTGNGYYGGLQFSHATWHGYGGGEFAEYPHEATREEQIIVAERLRAVRGYAPWPACRAELGLP